MNNPEIPVKVQHLFPVLDEMKLFSKGISPTEALDRVVIKEMPYLEEQLYPWCLSWLSLLTSFP